LISDSVPEPLAASGRVVGIAAVGAVHDDRRMGIYSGRRWIFGHFARFGEGKLNGDDAFPGWRDASCSRRVSAVGARGTNQMVALMA
jgi:hypothetical protein